MHTVKLTYQKLFTLRAFRILEIRQLQVKRSHDNSNNFTDLR